MAPLEPGLVPRVTSVLPSWLPATAPGASASSGALWAAGAVPPARLAEGGPGGGDVPDEEGPGAQTVQCLPFCRLTTRSRDCDREEKVKPRRRRLSRVWEIASNAGVPSQGPETEVFRRCLPEAGRRALAVPISPQRMPGADVSSRLTSGGEAPRGSTTAPGHTAR